MVRSQIERRYLWLEPRAFPSDNSSGYIRPMHKLVVPVVVVLVVAVTGTPQGTL